MRSANQWCAIMCNWVQVKISIRCSRFQTDAEAKRTLEGLADGTVDVVIGTHPGQVLADCEALFGE